MLDPRNDLLPPPSSPTNSSVSSSDLDTESTGSFFHDRSTTLGTLMGSANNAGGGGSRKTKKKKKNKSAAAAVAGVSDRRRRWWRLCRDDGTKPASLGEFLEVERRFGDGAFYNTAAELEGVMVAHSQSQQPRNGQMLFADGRVLPPSNVDDGPSSTPGVLCRFPVSLTAICSGGLA
ncbi:hypothetical protein M0R45_023005 [Rubus argutus]|uniref:Uncharacterized protein n=1 Tax=Rubus argutus TaxID=59490 RepID=A0AAW1WQ71_RUBAR